MLKLTTNLLPKGDQAKAIDEIINNFKKNKKRQVLLGATGTGKTFTIANVIEKIQKKTLIIVHNKTLAAQLYSEFKNLFKNNKVEYFVSYFDFYQPEAYIPRSDMYIEKSAQTNQEIEMLRLSTLNSLNRSDNDTIVISSVASIYTSVSPEDFDTLRILLKKNENRNLKQLQYDLARLQYKRNDIELKPGSFRLKGDILEIAPGYTDEYTIRISFFDNTIEEIATIEYLTNKVLKKWDSYVIAPANEYIMNKNRIKEAIKNIKLELVEQIKYFKNNNKLLEAQRIEERVKHDIESLEELGYCNGIENYSRHLELRASGQTPFTLFDYFGNDWLLVIDESHMTLPQIRGMYATDRSRKETLIQYGFRLPSALDNRPLNFDEFNSKIDKAIYVSATPNDYEKEDTNNTIVEQIVRPTGLIDPTIEIRSSKYQIDDLVETLQKQIKKKEKTLITVLTIKLAESLTDHLQKQKFNVAYLHNELKTLDRTKIINDLRKGKYDAIIGINLLREGLDIPEVSLVVIFDADKPGLFRNDKSLIQTFGRAARNVNGHIIMYGDKITPAMQSAIDETERRRKIQLDFNKKNNIKPETINKPIYDDLTNSDAKEIEAYFQYKNNNKSKTIEKIRKEMLQAAKNQEYERAIHLRDLIIELEEKNK